MFPVGRRPLVAVVLMMGAEAEARQCTLNSEKEDFVMLLAM